MAPTVASTGLYQGTARYFRPNWTTARISPSRQAPRPAQKYDRPVCPRFPGEFVARSATVEAPGQATERRKFSRWAATGKRCLGFVQEEWRPLSRRATRPAIL